MSQMGWPAIRSACRRLASLDTRWHRAALQPLASLRCPWQHADVFATLDNETRRVFRYRVSLYWYGAGHPANIGRVVFPTCNELRKHDTRLLLACCGDLGDGTPEWLCGLPGDAASTHVVDCSRGGLYTRLIPVSRGDLIMTLSSGSLCGPYQVISQLGSGGMGEVYKARDSRLGREVAIKVLRDEYAGDTERLTRFEQEARAASALNHPHIVTIFDIGQSDGRRFIAMEMIEGRTLREILKSGPLPISDALDVAVQVAEGLAKAHEAGIVHRDLKPENLMVTEDAFVKILDFGLAKLVRGPFELDTEGPTLAASPTRAGTLLGTVEYMSPEQAAGRPVDHRTDQFSLGSVIYEMVVGERPFQRETLAQTLAAIIEADVDRLDTEEPSVPSALADVVARCLAKKPAGRFESTRDLAHALRAIKEGGVPAVALRPQQVIPEAVPYAPETGDFLVQVDDRVRRMSERRLRRKLRRRNLSGLELVRRASSERWVVLHDTPIFREEVPVGKSSLTTARWRVVQGFATHLAAFIAMGIFMTSSTGHPPFWMAFWGIGLVGHGMRALPALVSLLGESWRSLPAGDKEDAAKALPGGRGRQSELSPSFIEEVDRVRALIRNRPKSEGQSLLAEIERLVASVKALSAKEKDLEEQTSARELDEMNAAEQEAQAKLVAAQTKYDRQLFQRQVDVLASHRRAIDKALVQLERMRVRRSLAEHQLKQLRLDLSQSEARRLAAPELSSRILDIRNEVDAFDEADELLADG
jgi:serine/threonine protein kinase